MRAVVLSPAQAACAASASFAVQSERCDVNIITVSEMHDHWCAGVKICLPPHTGKKSVFCIMRQLHSAQHKPVLGKFLPQLCSHRGKQRCTRGFRRHQMASPARLLSVRASCWLLLAANTVTSAFSAAPGTTYCGTTRANAASDAIPQLQQQTHGQTQFWGQSGWFRHGAGYQVPNLP